MTHNPADPDELRQYLLVLGCQAGDDHAFARLHERFADRTLRYLQGLVDDDAEDVQQEVWLSVYRSIRNLTNPRAFRTWLFQTTRHRAIDFLRRRRREQALLETVLQEAAPADGADGDEPEGLQDGGWAGLLSGLSPAHREVLLLRYQDDLSYEEIGLVVGCSIGTVRSRLHHAKRRLHELKGDRCHVPER